LHVPCDAYRDRMSAPLGARTTSSIARRSPLKELESRQVVGIVDE